MRPWIEPAEPIEIPRRFQDIMGWSAEDHRRAAKPEYPCLIDEQHVVAELYNIRNVPMGVWIDEGGRIVRPAEPTGATDGFRSLDRTTMTMPADAVAAGKAARKEYVDALRDWVKRGDASSYALSSSEVQERIAPPSHNDVLAAAHFRLGHHLRELGELERARFHFGEASRLCPERWHYLRQALELEGTGNASGPQFVAALKALGDRPYYDPPALSKQ